MKYIFLIFFTLSFNIKFQFIGTLTFAQILIAIIAAYIFFNFKEDKLDDFQKKIIILCFLWLISQIISDIYNNSIFKNHKQIKPQKYSNQIGFLGEHAKIYFKDKITTYTEKIRSRSIGYDVIEAIEGERSFLTVYGSKIWDLFPAMSFLKLLNFETNLPNMEFDYSKLEKKIIFYANL